MIDNVTNLYIQIALSIDNIIGKNKVIDANFTSIVPKQLFNNIELIFSKIEDLRELNRNTNDIFPFFKKTYINKQLNALELQLKIFVDPLKYQNNYIECLEVFLDTEIPKPSIEKITLIKDEIDQLLGEKNYKGNLKNKISTWKNDNRCSLKDYIKEIEKYSKLYRSITFERVLSKIFDSKFLMFLNNNDVINYEAVNSDEGWSAYNYYKGNYSGTVVFNEKASFHKNNIKTFISHEGYPGHHISGLIKEYYVKELLKDEYLGLQLLNVPSCLIEEGIADTGIELLEIDFTSIDETLEHLIDDLNANVNYLVCHELFVEHNGDTKAIGLLKNEKLLDEVEAYRSLKFIKSWKYYVPSYKLGRDLLRSLYSKIESKAELIELMYLCPNPSIIKKYYEENN